MHSHTCERLQVSLREAGRKINSINLGQYSGILVQTTSSLHSRVCKLAQGNREYIKATSVVNLGTDNSNKCPSREKQVQFVLRNGCVSGNIGY